MSLKSIGFSGLSGRGGQFNVPNILVKGGKIFEISNGTNLPQVNIENGLVELNQTMNQINQQLIRQQSKYNEDILAFNDIVALSPLAQLNTLIADTQQLLANVSNQYTPSVFTSPTISANYVRRGMGIATSSYNLFTFTATKSTVYFVSVNLALSMQMNQQILLQDNNNITVGNNQSNNNNGTYSQAYLQKNGETIAQFYSCKRTYKGTNIFISGSTYVTLALNDVLTILFDFTNSYATSGVDTSSSAQCYGTNFLDPITGANGQIVYNMPQSSQAGASGNVQGSLALNKGKSPSVTIVQF